MLPSILDEYRRLGLLPISGGEGDPPAAEDDAAPDDDADDADDLDHIEGLGDKGKAAIKRERAAAKAARDALTAAETARRDAERDLKALQKQLKDASNAGKSETERLTAERDDLLERLNTLSAKAREASGREAVREAARKAGASADAVDAIYRLVKADLSFDDDGEPQSLDALIKDAKQIAPQLFRPAAKADASAGNQGKPGKTDMNALLRQSLGYGSRS